MPPRPEREPTDAEFTVVRDPRALPGAPPVLPWWERAYRWMDRTGNAMGPPIRDRRKRERTLKWMMVAINPGIGVLAVLGMTVAWLFGCAH